MNIAAGDLGGAAAKYDIEAWLPGQGRYRELTSCSNTTDYQARRMQTRVRRAGGDVEVLHTLNGTATAIRRTLIAILENHQRGRERRAAGRAAPVPARAGAGSCRRPARRSAARPRSRAAQTSRSAPASRAARDLRPSGRHVDRDAVPALRRLVRLGDAATERPDPADLAVAPDHQ